MPNATTGAVIYRENNNTLEILLTKRNIPPFKNYWCLPGGHIEEYEPAVEAIMREVKEETNLDFIPRFLCYLDEIFTDIDLHNVVLMFYGNATGAFKADPVEVQDIRWFRLEDGLQMKLAFEHEKALKVFSERIQDSPGK